MVVSHIEGMLGASQGHAGHGPHVEELAGEPEQRITWYKAGPHVDRPREQRWTCQCRLTVYVLVVGAGRAWIRRVRKRNVADQRPEVVESEHLPHRDAAALWERLLLGRAR
ncbi:hypothetical protein Ssi03_41920 [Sphaerisporangium siamense]|nr:hypothetical protein Ssi03_41920 [Sphaerisporangium siamense]